MPETAPATDVERRPGETLRASSVSRSFEGVHALSDVTLEVRQHEVVGPDRPERRGQVDARERADRVRPAGRRHRRARGPRDHRLERASPRPGRARAHASSTAGRSATCPCGRTSRWRRSASGPARARRAVAPIGCSSSSAWRRSPTCRRRRSSHGDERRLGVARVLATEPSFVLMDEPAAGLPEAEVPEFAEVVRSLRDEHETGVLLIDHNMALVMGVCDWIHVLDQGRTLAAGAPEEIRGNLDVAAAYLGETAVHDRRCLSRSSSWTASRCATARVAAVRDVALRVDKGEIVGLIGPNGAGKSTTLHAIMGVVPPSAGEIRLRGRSLRRKSSESIAHAGVALVPEGRRIFSGFTVEENLRLGLAARRRNGGGDPLAVAYDLFPILKEFRRRNAGHLSGGQQQQLAIGRALVAEPDVLLLDEPSLGPGAARRRQRLRGAARHPRARRHDPARGAARAPHGRPRRPHARARRAASWDSRSHPPTPTTPTRSSPPTSPRDHPRRPRLPDALRRSRARRDLRPDGRRDRPRLRGAAARQLRLRPAGDGRRVHARLHLELADLASILACFAVVVALSLAMDTVGLPAAARRSRPP